ncbi:pullulanase [Candidatus Mycobacterium methanotrophicum]|uniref:Pullulanase n=1 Tax=Candidatus Mycobacterium methanotrophicum TaxID=2943498 RepID=A0ABY4QME7_9MYCO|nr:pullulanase [Candidatus Mycobacterium methanotrophicum]UQX11016.1 pullulanase [Candidatus Mycobacterium methanotrophicum]
MEYCLGDGDGTATIWDRGADIDLDGDGRLDAVSLDFDGDGLADDALADFDGDGLADHAVLDLDKGGLDGSAARYFTDDGSGTWAVAANPPRAGQPAQGNAAVGQLRWLGLDGVEHTSRPLVDFDGDGQVDDRLLDSDGNGLADRAIVADDNGVTGYVDTDGDGRWDVKLTDIDGDGTADAAATL